MRNPNQKGNAVIILIVIVILIAGGWYFFQKNSTDQRIGNNPKQIIVNENTEVKVTGPTKLKDGEIGTWVVSVAVDESESASYGVIWGDESEYKNVLGGMPLSSIVYQKTPTFSHKYFKVASTGTTWTPVFFVKDSQGNTVRKAAPVNVGM